MIHIKQCIAISFFSIIITCGITCAQSKLLLLTFVIPDDLLLTSHRCKIPLVSSIYLNNTSKYFCNLTTSFHFHARSGNYINNDFDYQKIFYNFYNNWSRKLVNAISFCTSPASVVVMNVNNSKFQKYQF